MGGGGSSLTLCDFKIFKEIISTLEHLQDVIHWLIFNKINESDEEVDVLVTLMAILGKLSTEFSEQGDLDPQGYDSLCITVWFG